MSFVMSILGMQGVSCTVQRTRNFGGVWVKGLVKWVQSERERLPPLPISSQVFISQEQGSVCPSTDVCCNSVSVPFS